MPNHRPSTLDALRQIGEQIRTAEATGAERSELLVLWQQRRDLVREAVADERRVSDIGRALGVSQPRASQLVADAG